MLMTEIEAVLNLRPLAYVSTDDLEEPSTWIQSFIAARFNPLQWQWLQWISKWHRWQNETPLEDLREILEMLKIRIPVLAWTPRVSSYLPNQQRSKGCSSRGSDCHSLWWRTGQRAMEIGEDRMSHTRSRWENSKCSSTYAVQDWTSHCTEVTCTAPLSTWNWLSGRLRYFTPEESTTNVELI